MSGILNVLIASFGGGPAPVGLLAAIRNPANTDVQSGAIVIRNDQLNLVVNTSDGTPSIQRLVVARLSLDLAFTWQRAISNEGQFPRGFDVAIDSAGNVIVVGTMFDSLNSLQAPYIVKLNSSGTVQWQNRLNGRITYAGVITDSSDSIYAVGYAELFAANRYDIYAVKYNSSGTVQYQRNIGDTGTVRNELAYSVALPNSSTFVVAGEAQVANVDALLWFLNQSDGTTSNTLIQKRSPDDSNEQGVAVIKGETDDVLYYAIRSTTGFTGKTLQVLYKWTTAGGFVWQRVFSDPGTSSLFVFSRSLAMSADNTAVYVVAQLSDNKTIQITKWGIDGSLLWQRALTSPSAASLTNGGISVDSLDNIYVQFNVSATTIFTGIRAMVLKMPGSGAGSGNSTTLEGVQYDYITTTRNAGIGFLVFDALSRPNSSSSTIVLTPSATSTAGTLAVSSAPI
jgi:hypothetical protein